MLFDDRDDAGRQLAAALGDLTGQDVVVLGLPRGGVPVAAHVADALGAPLDVIIVRKLGVPFQPELAFGAVGEDGVVVLNDDVVRVGEVSDPAIARITQREQREVSERARRFRHDRGPLPLTGRTAVIVDDGVATGATARAACEVARAHGARAVVLAAPVGAARTLAALARVADRVVCLNSPQAFGSVGQYYRDFTQVPDETVIRLLDGR